MKLRGEVDSLLKLHITKQYYKKVQRGRDPIRFHVEQPNGVGTDMHAVIKLDPILKKHNDLRKVLLKHETDEMMAWGKGSTRAHTLARKKEPKAIRYIGGVSGFWNEIKRREK